MTPRIRAIGLIGANRPPCEQTIRVAEGLTTRSAQYGAAERERKGLPIDQCGHRADYLFDGTPLCRAHAGQRALRVLLAAPGPVPPPPACGCTSICAGDRCPHLEN